MTEQELIRKQEEGGNETLYLMKVGMFFHAYDAGAFALARLMHYRVKRKARKGGREVLVAGFPHCGGWRQGTGENGHMGGVCGAGRHGRRHADRRHTGRHEENRPGESHP